MRIAYILNSTIPSGGATKSFLTTLQLVRQAGNETLVVMPDCHGIYSTLEEMGCSVLALNYRSCVYPSSSGLKNKLLWLPRLFYWCWLNACAVKSLKREIQRYSPDIIHTNVGVVDIGIKVAKSLNISHVFHFREFGDLDFRFRYFPSKRIVMSRVTNCVAITKGVYQHHDLAKNSTHSVVIYDPMAPSCEPKNLQKRGNYLLFAGRLNPGKGADQLLEAYCKSAPSYPLWLAGNSNDDEFLMRLKQMPKRYDLQDNVKFLGERDDVDKLMYDALALVVPSEFEAFGRCMPEAMLQGCLVVGHDTGGTKEQLDNGVEGTDHEIALRYSTTEELADILRQLDAQYKHPDTALEDSFDTMRMCAYTALNSYYSYEVHIDKLMAFYKDILSTRK